MIHTLHLRLLGPVQIEQDGVVVQRLGSQKSLVLLAYLVSIPQEHSRARLAALLWPDHPDDKARSNLRWAINNLANLLPNALTASRHTLQFRPSPSLWIDVSDFDQQIAVAQPDTLAAVIDLFRGDFLDGITIDDSPDLELWLLQERESRRQRVITTLERVIEQTIYNGQVARAQGFLTLWLELEPWREEAHCRLMQLLASSGQRSAALAQFELCRKILAKEVAAEPSPETIALFQRIQAGEFDKVQLKSVGTPADIAEPPPHNLPRERTPFVGRAQEMAALREQILQKKHPLITVRRNNGVAGFCCPTIRRTCCPNNRCTTDAGI